MGKQKVSLELKFKAIQEYLSGEGSYMYLGRKYNVSANNIRHWVGRYLEHGEAAFTTSDEYARYPLSFKMKCVKAVLCDGESVNSSAMKYNVSKSVLQGWIKRYNANKELKDYNPSREVYMASASRKTTLEERIEIARYCIEHNKSYATTASLYNVSYDQVYIWVKKYLSDGENGLTDKRGRRKSDDEVNELEQLRRENLRLKQKLKEQDMAVELLKKAKEFERM
jgi:transposase-like protein